MTDLLQGLNPAQREAVTATEGFVRVVAGAGSGKTRALTHRFAYLVNELGILPGNILCVTFTNKSAGEMRQRIHALTGDNDTGYINTFHGFCVSVLQEDSHAVQYPRSFLVLDNSDIDAMLQIIYEERGLTLRDMTFSAARDMIEIQKLFQRPDYYRDLTALSLDALKEKYDRAVSPADIIFYGYLYQEKKCFGLDYNDLIKFSLYIFQEHPDIKLKWQQRLEYIMIDEFQDIDQLQYELMEVLCGYHKNLFIVGDPDQTIYTWRGANVKYLLDFDQKFPGTKTVLMMENYRSTPEILAAANSLIAKNRDRIEKVRRLMPDTFFGVDVIVGFPTETDEDFAQTYHLLESLEPAYLHVFPFSERPGTPAATMEGKVKDSVKTERAARLNDLCSTLHDRFCRRYLGSEADVLFEGRGREGMMFGYTGNYIKCKAPYDARLVNRIVPVRLTALTEDGVTAKLLADGTSSR